MKRWLKITLSALLMLIIVIVAAVSIFLNQIIKAGVETGGPAVLGVPVTLEKADFSLLRGKAVLEELVIGNPEGFKSPFLFKMGELLVEIDRGSLATDTIVIKRILIEGPEISYEKSLKTSNIGQLLKNLEGEEKPEEEPEPEKEVEEPKEEDGGKKVVLEEFLLTGGRIKFSATLTGGKALVIPLPPVKLTDVGKESGGASIPQIIKEIMTAILSSVTKAVTGSVEFVGDGVEVVGGAAVEGVEMVGGAAAQGAKAAGDAAKKGGEAAAGGAKKTLKGVTGLFGRDEEKSE